MINSMFRKVIKEPQKNLYNWTSNKKELTKQELKNQIKEGLDAYNKSIRR